MSPALILEMLADLMEPRLAAVMVATFVAAFVRGMAGFGAALILTPVFSAFYGPAVAVPTLGLVDSIVATPMGVRAVRRCDWRQVLPIAAAAMVALPFGVWLLTTIDELVLRIVMSLFVLLAVLALWSGWRYHGRPGMGITLTVGVASGITTGAIGMGGPPVVLFWLGSQAAAAQARTNTLAFFCLVAGASFLAYLTRGLFTDRVLLLVAVLFPLYGLGLYAGSRAFALLPERLYRRIAFGLVAATAATTLVAALIEATA